MVEPAETFFLLTEIRKAWHLDENNSFILHARCFIEAGEVSDDYSNLFLFPHVSAIIAGWLSEMIIRWAEPTVLRWSTWTNQRSVDMCSFVVQAFNFRMRWTNWCWGAETPTVALLPSGGDDFLSQPGRIDAADPPSTKAAAEHQGAFFWDLSEWSPTINIYI